MFLFCFNGGKGNVIRVIPQIDFQLSWDLGYCLPQIKPHWETTQSMNKWGSNKYATLVPQQWTCFLRVWGTEDQGKCHISDLKNGALIWIEHFYPFLKTYNGFRDHPNWYNLLTHSSPNLFEIPHVSFPSLFLSTPPHHLLFECHLLHKYLQDTYC